jgi:autotransporter-associated beta strand protein
MSAVAGLSLTPLLFLFCAGTVQAQTIIDPLVYTFSSQNPYGLDRAVVHTVDGSGLTAGPSGILGAADSTVDTSATPNMWTTTGNQGPTDLNPSVTYDLGGFCNLQTVRIWNYNEGGFSPIGASDILLSTSADGTNFTQFGLIHLALPGRTNGLPAEDFAVSVANVRYVQFQILTNWDGAIFWDTITGADSAGSDGRALTGLSEVRFVGALLTTPDPIFSLPGGRYFGSVAVAISDSDANATIYYSTNAWATTNVYSGVPIAVPGNSAGFNLRAFAKDPSFVASQVVSATYYTIPSAVWINPNGGSWADTSTFSWSNNVPANGTGVNADFSKLVLPNDAIVTLDGNWAVGSLTFGDVGNSHTWELDAGTGGYLVLAGTNTPNITVVNQSVTMTVALRGGNGGLNNGLTKTGAGTLRLGLGTVNDYSGATTVSSGTLAVDGSLGISDDVTVTGGTLSGIGSIGGSVTVNSGGTFMPGTSSLNDGLTISGYRLVLQGNTLMRIAVNANTPANNQVSLSGTVTYGGVLTVTNITSDGSLLTAGNTFILFNGAPAHAGAFNSYHLPALPAGLSWDVSGLYVNGSISVTANTPAPLFNPPGGTFVPPLAVTISCPDASAIIYYSTNAGATTNVYNGTPVNVPTNANGFVIQAYAKDPSLSGSSAVSASYTASPVITPSGVVYSSQLIQYDRKAVYTIDGSGLIVGPSGILGAADSTVDVNASGAMWMSTGNQGPNDFNPYVIYDLGVVYNLQTTRIWNYNETGYTKFGDSSILLSTSADGVNFTQFGIINPAQGGGTSAEPAQDFATAVSGVRYVKMQILTNWDGAIFWSSITGGSSAGITDNRSISGLSEVRFVGTPANAQPVISGGASLGGGQFKLTFSGPGNQNYSVLSSTNLALPLPSWTVLTNGLFGGGAVNYTNTTATNKTQFYIIRSP